MDPVANLSSRLGAELSWANTADRSARTRPARQAFEHKFLDAADGDPVRAEHLRRAHYLRLALKSAQARRKAKEGREALAAADAELAEAGLSGGGTA